MEHMGKKGEHLPSMMDNNRPVGRILDASVTSDVKVGRYRRIHLVGRLSEIHRMSGCFGVVKLSQATKRVWKLSSHVGKKTKLITETMRLTIEVDKTVAPARHYWFF